MTVSAFDLFKVDVGPSSRRCVSPVPMLAGYEFADSLLRFPDSPELAAAHEIVGGAVTIGEDIPADVAGSITIILYGSLAATGAGHGLRIAEV